MGTARKIGKAWLLVAVCAAAVGWEHASAQVQQVAQPEGSGNGAAGPLEAPAKEMAQTLSARLGVVLPGVIATEELPLLDLVLLRDQLDGPEGGPMYEGIQRDMPAFDLGMGQWFDVPAGQGGGWLWVLDIKSPGAFAVRPHFANFNLPLDAVESQWNPAVKFRPKIIIWKTRQNAL